MFRKKTILLLGIMLLFFAFCLNYSAIKEQYLFLFKKTGVIKHNNKGKLEVDSIIDGHVQTKVSYSNDLRQSWVFNYYKSGKLKNKYLFKRNEANGPEFGYYENGALEYVANNIDNKWVGDAHWYTENGNLDSYAAFNIKGKSFCLFQYDKFGKIINMKGVVVSPDLYSINPKDSIILLDLYKNKNYDDISDLFLVVATPPNLHLKVVVNINNTQYKDLPIRNNIITVHNAFLNKGTYKIFIESHLYDKNNTIVNGVNIKTKIIKE